MNLTKLFDMQRVLDERIEKEHPRVEGEDRLAKKILALQVELGELANEWRGFKFWSKDQDPRTEVMILGFVVEHKNLLLEEYVDCLHFILSIGLELKQTNPRIYVFKYEFEKEMVIVDSFLTVLELTRELDMPLKDYDLAFSRFIELGELLGFTWDQIEQAYYDKNEVNHTRQNTGY